MLTFLGLGALLWLMLWKMKGCSDAGVWARDKGVRFDDARCHGAVVRY